LTESIKYLLFESFGHFFTLSLYVIFYTIYLYYVILTKKFNEKNKEEHAI